MSQQTTEAEHDAFTSYSPLIVIQGERKLFTAIGRKRGWGRCAYLVGSGEVILRIYSARVSTGAVVVVS